MAQDHSLTGELVLRKAWDDTNGALKTSLNSEFAVELSHADGDSSYAVSKQTVITGASTTSATEIKSLVIYTEPGTGSAKVEVSPLATGNVWVDLVSITADGTLVVKSAVTELRAARIRITTTGPVVHTVLNG